MREFFAVVVAVAFSVPLYSQGFPPDTAASKMTLAEGLEIKLIASEPLVRQPVAIEFDDRGRLWVIQYLQYPNPDGLKRKTVDRFSRTEYDRVPEPPPKGPAGADRITILSDTDGDGVMDRGHDFVKGLNLTSGLAFGHGGVFVLNVPYLLFYPDRDRNDVPDSDPEVLLTGFGMQDAHSVANSLTWGPDGWLYGCQGSTVTSNINGIEFQQGVWRYHPFTKKFELFCEGGGNAWGLDFDADGNLLYSTNYGGYVLVHGVQGGNYVKSFAKHGQLHNPFAYGYFEHAPHKEFLGGHVTVGGIVYQGGALPRQFRGKYLAGDLLGHAAYYHQLVPHGSTFKTETVGKLLDSHDTWFAPTDMTVGPDGSVYISDWHDARTAHPDPDAQWDRSNGRIYRLSGKSIQRENVPPIDFAKLGEVELLAMHMAKKPNPFLVRRARQELVRRDDGTRRLGQNLIELTLASEDANLARELFWTFLSLEVPQSKGSELFQLLQSRLLQSPHAVIRYWTIRWIGDIGYATDDVAHQLDAMAETEASSHVRSQLASTAARLPADQAMPIINANINRDIDSDDPFLPLQWWWAVEKHSVKGREEVMKRFTRPTLWKSKLGRDVLLVRLVRRYMAEGSAEGMDCVLRILKAAPDAAARDALWPHMLLGWQDVPADVRAQRDTVASTHPLSTLVQSEWSERPSPALARLAMAMGHEQPRQQALATAVDRKLPAADRLAALQLLADHPNANLIESLTKLYELDEPESIQQAALRGLGKLDAGAIGKSLVKRLSSSQAASPAMRTLEHDLIFSRRDWAMQWLQAVDRQEIKKESVTLDQVRRLAALEDSSVNELVAKHWGKLSSATPEEKLAEVRRLNNDLRAASGDAAVGKQLFKKHCATCHRLHNEGGTVGPDLTSANRKDRDFLLVSLVDPSSVIRKEYLSVIVRTDDDRIFTGVPLPATGGGIKLINAKGETIELAADEVAEVKQSSVSIMPEDLYKQLTPAELRDLFAYLMAN